MQIRQDAIWARFCRFYYLNTKKNKTRERNKFDKKKPLSSHENQISRPDDKTESAADRNAFVSGRKKGVEWRRRRRRRWRRRRRPLYWLNTRDSQRLARSSSNYHLRKSIQSSSYHSLFANSLKISCYSEY